MNNNYQALARKWRPSNFAEFVGQEHVTTTLVNSLNNQRMHHAYLFSGTRGVGKTTLARIIAKCISCEQGVSSEPCGNCNACVSLQNNNYFDLIEVDAASKTKVEDTRELIDNMQFAPSAGKYRIYIIDEVHMLSKHSFNALLKTLEEPPEHVKFIFATTEVNKLPITILSRTIHFKLKAIPTHDIQAHLEKILTQENITFAPQAINTIAIAAKGSVRDSLSILEQCIAFCDQKLTTEQVNEVLGVVEDEHLYQLLIAIINNNPIAAMDQISQLAELAIDFSKVAEAMLLLLHAITKAQLDTSLISDNYQTATITDLAKQITPEDLQLLYQTALLGKQDLAISPNLQTGFEMLIIRMMIFMPATQQTKKK